MGRRCDLKTVFGTAIFAACLLVALIFVYFAVFGKARAQTPAPSQPFQRQLEGLSAMFTKAGVVPGLKYSAGGTNYVIKLVEITFDRNGNHTVTVKSEVAK
jgi:heme/copper-type cytochrome/quinol oxidase subunit 2